MKILYIFLRNERPASAVYGLSRRFIEIVQAYERHGVRVYTLERYPSQRVGLPLDSSVIRLEPGTRIPLLRTIVFGAFAFLKGLDIAKKSRGLDIIICGERNLTNVLSAFMLSVALRKPFVVVMHHPKKEKGMSSLAQSVARSLIVKHAALRLTVSEGARKEFARSWKVSQEDFVVTGNGVSQPPRLEGVSRRYDALYVGGFYEPKGVNLLPLIWKRVSMHVRDAKIVIVGGLGHEPQELEAVFKEMGLERNVLIRGYVSDGELSDLFRASRVFVLPSMREGFSIATAQAMAHGCACVLSDLQALRSVFGNCALYAPPGNSAAFAAAILSLLADQKKQQALSDLGIALSKDFSWDVVASQEIGALRGVVNG
jgi:glycosyltransferase involved in cell wall biosynthesis